MGKANSGKTGGADTRRAAKSSDAMGKEARTGVAALCCTVGMIGSQTWMPAVGLFADMYRAGSFSVENGAPLFLSYLVALALVASLFAVLRLKSAPGKGTYAALVGALLSCIGTVLLLLFDEVDPRRMGLLLSLTGLLLGSGNCLMVMAWSSMFAKLRGKALFSSALGVAVCCCILASFAQMVGATAILLAATAGLSAVSAACYVVLAVKSEVLAYDTPSASLGSAYVRIGCSLGCFGFLFTMMIMQFAIAPHGQASPHTWMFGFAGIAAAAAILAAGRIARKGWDFVFAYRFVVIPVLIAFFPFDPGSDFSLKFALCFSTMALWCFLTIVPGVLGQAAATLRVPVFFTAGIGIGGLCIGAVVGYFVAWFVEFLDPTPNYYINVTAIISMAIGLIGSNIVLTKGSLIRAYRRASAASGDSDDADATTSEKVARVVEAYGLTNRESDVLLILARGHGLARVQEDLFISEGTALTHKRHIYQKLDVHSKSELIDLVACIDIGDVDED